jgi:regulator of RNase E activity RraA
MPAAVPALIQRLSQFDTPTVCNVIELFDSRPYTAGYMNSRIRACFPHLPPMVGYAATATFRSAFPPARGTLYSSLSDQVASFASLPGSAVVVFQDLDDPVAAATFGEVMCTTYKAFGAAGLISSGAGRDLDQVEALGFPCFTSGAVCAHGYCHFADINVPVHVGGICIRPGDLLHGDRNGVTTIPHEIATAVAEACPEFMQAESVVLDYLKSGPADSARYTAARNECRDRIETLARRLKG